MIRDSNLRMICLGGGRDGLDIEEWPGTAGMNIRSKKRERGWWQGNNDESEGKHTRRKKSMSPKKL